MEVAIVVYDGVLRDECEAFTSVLGLMDGARVVTVGARRGPVDGPGGRQHAELAFDDVERVDIAIVPGGIGCERAAGDPRLRVFLQRMERSASYLAASSTGTVLLAAAGVLHGQPAVTHWLAGDLLRRYGSEVDDRRLTTTGNVITCSGQISAVDAAFALVTGLEGPGAASRIRATLIERGRPLLHEPTWSERLADRWRALIGARDGTDRVDRSRQAIDGPAPAPEGSSSPGDAPLTPLSVMVELVDNEDLARRMKRTARRRR